MKGTITPPTFTTDNIQQLDDVVVGQATSLKILFDKTGDDAKNYIVDTMIPELNGNTGSNKIGHLSAGVSADNVGDAIQELAVEKLDQGSNFTGTWQGYSPVETDPGIQAVVNENFSSITNLKIPKKPAFLEQYITGFYSRGQLLSEKATENTITEVSVTISRTAGYGGVEISNTTPFKEGSIIVIKYDDGTYGTHFVRSVIGSTSLAIIPPILKNTTTNTKIERGWYNSAHAGKFYMRYLAQRLSEMVEVSNGYGENAFYANFDGDSTDDIGISVSGATIGYNNAINKGVNYGTVLESGVGKSAFFETATVGGGIKFPSFYAVSGKNYSLQLFIMSRVAGNTVKVAVKSDIEEVASFTITGVDSQIMKPYKLDFTAPYNTNLLYVEITNQTSVLNVVFIDEVKIMTNLFTNDFVLPRKGKILCLGDSWISGDLLNTSEREPITQHLSALLPNATIINKGVGGNRIQDLIARFDADVVPNNPDIVVIHTGVNDCYNPASATFDPIAIDYFVGRMNELVEKCISINARPVVIGVPALCEEDLTFTTFLLNDRARLYNKSLYRNIFNDVFPNSKLKKLDTNSFGKLENNNSYLAGNNYKDVNISVGATTFNLKKVLIEAAAFDAGTAANILLKIYDSTRTTLLATSNTITIEAGSAIQKREFIIPRITLSASTNYILAFEGTNLWSVYNGGAGVTKNYGKFTINNMKIGNTTPPGSVLAAWIGMVLVPDVGVSSIVINNLPTRYKTWPVLTTINSDSAISIMNHKNEVVKSIFSKVGDEFYYKE